VADVERLKQMAEEVRQRAGASGSRRQTLSRELPGVDRDCPLTSDA
jgi:hypothetical protein